MKLDLDEIKKKIDTKYPPNIFIDYDKGISERGVQEETYIRRLNEEDRRALAFLDYLIMDKKI